MNYKSDWNQYWFLSCTAIHSAQNAVSVISICFAFSWTVAVQIARTPSVIWQFICICEKRIITPTAKQRFHYFFSRCVSHILISRHFLSSHIPFVHQLNRRGHMSICYSSKYCKIVASGLFASVPSYHLRIVRSSNILLTFHLDICLSVDWLTFDLKTCFHNRLAKSFKIGTRVFIIIY